MISEPVIFKMDEENALEQFNVGLEFLDKFEANKNYYMWVETNYDTYRFTVKKAESGSHSSRYWAILWQGFWLNGIDTKNLHWKKSPPIKMQKIPEEEQVTGPFAKNFWGGYYESILSEKWAIWVKVGNYYITPNFKDIPSFLYRELLLSWDKTGSENDQLKIWFEEIIIPMAINRGKI